MSLQHNTKEQAMQNNAHTKRSYRLGLQRTHSNNNMQEEKQNNMDSRELGFMTMDWYNVSITHARRIITRLRVTQQSFNAVIIIILLLCCCSNIQSPEIAEAPNSGSKTRGCEIKP